MYQTSTVAPSGHSRCCDQKKSSASTLQNKSPLKLVTDLSVSDYLSYFSLSKQNIKERRFRNCLWPLGQRPAYIRVGVPPPPTAARKSRRDADRRRGRNSFDRRPWHDYNRAREADWTESVHLKQDGRAIRCLSSRVQSWKPIRTGRVG